MRLLLTNRLFLTTAFFTLTVTASAQDLRPIFDARKRLTPTKPMPAEAAALAREVKPAARKFWGKRLAECDLKDFVVVDVANGAFTKPNVSQRVVLYRHCWTRPFTLSGLAVFESNRVITHFAFEGGSEIAIGALPDLNGNGQSEILLAASQVISVLELSGKGVRSLGSVETQTDECPYGQGKTTAYKIYVHTGASLAFFREAFSKNCKPQSAWVSSGRLQQFSPDSNKIQYHRLK